MIYYRPQRSCEVYVFTGVCLSTGGVGLLSQHALQVVSQHALQQVVSWGVGITACLAGFQAHTQGGSLGGFVQGGLQATPKGEVEGIRSRPTAKGEVEGDQAGGTCSWGVETPPADGYCCGRYASYWNAFLFLFIFTLNFCVYRSQLRLRLG